MGGVLFFAAICGRCMTHYARKVAVEVMMERTNCLGALKT